MTEPTIETIETPKKNRRLVLIIGAAAALGIAIFAAVILPGLLRPARQFEGVIALVSSTPGAISGTWDNCSGQRGYSDFNAGAPTTIKDGNGNIVGSVTARNLTDETLEMLAADLRPTGYGSTPEEVIAAVKKYQQVACHLYISGQVQDADYYTFTFSDRGDFTYSRDELNQRGWYVELSLGD